MLDALPKASDLIQVFRQSLTHPFNTSPVGDRSRPRVQPLPPNSPLLNDRYIRIALIQLEDDLLISNAFSLDIKLPGVILERFHAVLDFPFPHQRRRPPHPQDPAVPQ